MPYTAPRGASGPFPEKQREEIAMPKFKDLGINAIPLTMQPPEIGDGGGGGPQCQDQTHDGDCDKEKTTDREECEIVCTTDRECYVPGTTDRECDAPGTTDRECEGPSTTDRGCEGPGTTDYVPPKSPGASARNASAFSPEAVAQLRQQIDARTNDQL